MANSTLVLVERDREEKGGREEGTGNKNWGRKEEEWKTCTESNG